MRLSTVFVLSSLQLIWPMTAFSQVVLTGRLLGPRFSGAAEMVPFTAVRCFASLDGSGSQALGFRTWETEPTGWYFMPGPAGNYTLVFSGPNHFMRPIVMTNLYTRPGDKLDRVVTPEFDYFVFYEGAWDEKAAGDYYQTFVARGSSVTQVGFKLAHDGVDGGGPKGQNLLISIHRAGKGTPDTWEQVGPTARVLNVDCGGPKNYTWSAGWNSGEVPTQAGETYAVHLTAESASGAFQPFWRPDEKGEIEGDCYRIGTAGKTGLQGCDLWMAVSSDRDGLVIPYNKRVHKEYGEFAGFAAKWSQTYVARGRGLASVILYTAVGGTQPPLSRQRAVVRVRRGGPEGPTVGVEKIAIGNGTYTGDASWGAFGAAFAPGEIPLVPGDTYAIEFNSIENFETLHGFVNIKGQVSDERVGFNPYRKFAPDAYERGTAYLNGTKAADCDLDMQILEYEFAAAGWADALHTDNLLKNGDMESGSLSPEKVNKSRPDAWKTFSIDPGTTHHYLADGKEKDNRIVRLIGGSINAKTVDGGFVQRVGGLSHLETYRLSGRVRCSFAVDDKHQCYVGCDPTGQDENPKAETIRWTTLPNVHGVFVPHTSEPIRPVADAVSVWLRGRTTSTVDATFKADFDDFALRRVVTGVPSKGR